MNRKINTQVHHFLASSLKRFCYILLCLSLTTVVIGGCSDGRSANENGGGSTNTGGGSNGGGSSGGGSGGGDSGGGDSGGDTGGGDSGGGDTGGGDTGGNNCSEDCLRINEAVSSNSEFEDEDGDSPDWFELYNYGTQAIQLNGWTISDDETVFDKWTFPEHTLGSGEYLRVWASDKGNTGVGVYRTLVTEGDEFSYLVPTSQPASNWNTLSFDDSSWSTGNSGFGYADGDDATTVSTGTLAIFVRKIFQITNRDAIEELLFDIDYDDAFVAYINGVEIARSNMLGDTPNWDDSPTAEREASMYQSGRPVRFPVNDFSTLLNIGDNVLSIQVHNASANSSDITLIPFLSALYNTASTEGGTPPEILALDNKSFHTNFKISSGGETLYLYNPTGSEIDQLAVEGLTTGYSVGRSRSTGNTVYYDTATPGRINSASEYGGIVTSEIIFSHQGGVNSPASVTLSGEEGAEVIRYTLDSTIPTASSSLYNSAINISGNSVIRARIFNGNFVPSPTESRTFLPEANHDLPVVTLVTEPDNLFDHDTGIYSYGDNYEQADPHYGANFWQDWEKPIHFSFYEANGTLGTELDGGVKIFGGWSRAHDQRSLSIFARARYGEKNIDYPIFPSRPYQKFKSVVLRNSGNDWMRTMLRDVALTSLMDGSGLDTQAYRSAATYINGEYWGMYNIREKVNEDYLGTLHDVDPDTIDELEREGAVIEGSNTDYLALVNFVENNSLSDADNYAYVAGEMDIDNFIRYQVAQIYFNNQDWPGNNVKFWRSPGRQWRWILYDTDFGFGVYNAEDYYEDTLSFALEENGPSWPNPPWSTLLLRRLIENDNFKHQFINQFADEFNGRFKGADVASHIDAIASTIQSEMPRHFERWQNSTSSSWSPRVNDMKTFGHNRPAQLLNHIENYFGITQMHQLTITNGAANQGDIQLNSLRLTGASWSGDYFDDIPVTVTALPAQGYRFVRWQGASSSTSASISLVLTSNTSLEAVFAAE